MQTSQTTTTSDSDDEKQTEAPKQKKILDEEYERDSLIEEESFRAGKFNVNNECYFLFLGRVSSGMYLTFVKEFGIPIFIAVVLCLFVGSTTARMLSNLYMANWSSNPMNKTREESLHSLVVFGAFGLAAGEELWIDDYQ
jgi:hypothetical protein